MTDKNGNKIFEGDICKYRFDYASAAETERKERVARVFWNDFRGAWAIYNSFKETANQDLSKFVQNGNTVEVIGNKWDNPELLEVRK